MACGDGLNAAVSWFGWAATVLIAAGAIVAAAAVTVLVRVPPV